MAAFYSNTTYSTGDIDKYDNICICNNRIEVEEDKDNIFECFAFEKYIVRILGEFKPKNIKYIFRVVPNARSNC
jgi:hypothetical protein